MMDRFVILVVLFALVFLVGGRPTEISKKETGNGVVNTIAPPNDITQVLTTEGFPPTSSIKVQSSTGASRKSTSQVHLISVLTTDDPMKTDPEATKDSPLSFLTSDIKKLNILVIALAAVLMVLVVVIVILGILRRRMRRKMRRMKQEKEETTTTDVAITPSPTTTRFYNVETPPQPVEYEVPYAHQQVMTAQIMALANQNPSNNNVTNQTSLNGLPMTTTTFDNGEYVNPSGLFGIIAEESKSTNENNQEYKVPRSANQMTTNDGNLAVNNNGTLKDSRGYVIMSSYAGPMEEQGQAQHAQNSGVIEGQKPHVYDVPSKTGRSTDTFSRSTIRSKIKLFQEKLKHDKSKHAAPVAEDEGVSQKECVRESMVPSTAYDTPRI